MENEDGQTRRIKVPTSTLEALTPGPPLCTRALRQTDGGENGDRIQTQDQAEHRITDRRVPVDLARGEQLLEQGSTFGDLSMWMDSRQAATVTSVEFCQVTARRRQCLSSSRPAC